MLNDKDPTLYDMYANRKLRIEGHVKIGEKVAGAKFPQKLGHFRFVDNLKAVINELHHADAYTMTPKRIWFTLGYDKFEENLTLMYGSFGQTKTFLRCFGTGKTAFRLWRDNLAVLEPALYAKYAKMFPPVDGNLPRDIPCPGPECEIYQAGRCKRTGVLPMFVLYPDTPAMRAQGKALTPYGGGVGKIFTLWTTGQNTITAMTHWFMSYYEWAVKVVGPEKATLAGIPFALDHETDLVNMRDGKPTKVPVLVPRWMGTPAEFTSLARRLATTEPPFTFATETFSEMIKRIAAAVANDADHIDEVGQDFFPEGEEAEGEEGAQMTLDAAVLNAFNPAPAPVPPASEVSPSTPPAAAPGVVEAPPPAVAKALAAAEPGIDRAVEKALAGGFTPPTGPANPQPAFFTAPASPAVAEAPGEVKAAAPEAVVVEAPAPPPVPPPSEAAAPAPAPPAPPVPPSAEAAENALAALDSIASLDGDDPKVTQAALDAAKIAAAAEQQKRDADKARAEAEKAAKPRRAAAKKAPTAPPAIPSGLLEP